MKEPLYARDDFLACFQAWWSGMSGQPLDGEGEAAAPRRGPRAELRHARGVLDVCMAEAFALDLLEALRREGIVPSDKELDGLARLAGLSAHVKTMVAGRHMAAVMGSPKGTGSRPAVAPQRFRKFLLEDDFDAFYTGMVRVLRMTDGVGALKSLARACFDWENENTRRWWALEYYNALPSGESEQ